VIYPSIRKIRSFVAVAENVSFRKASEVLHLSQPAISAHVRDLEALLGVPLLSRTTRSVRVTREGEHFLNRARRALSELESVSLELREEAALRRGHVTVSCIPTIAFSILPALLAEFSRRYDGIRVSVLDEPSTAGARRVLSLEADLGIGPRPAESPELSFDTLVRDDFIAVFPSNHELASRRTVRIRDLAKYPFLTLAPNTNVREVLDAAFAAAGQTLEPLYAPCHPYTIGAMVEAGLGVTALPSMSLSLLGHRRLKSVRIVDPGIHREIGILQRRDSTLSPAAAEFLKTTRAVFAASAPGGSAGAGRRRGAGRRPRSITFLA
jgi:LysR family transcriptional regulator, carnitine catabolism transcriptional activator